MQYKVLGTGQKPVEVNGTNYNTGDVIELSEAAAADALAASKIAPVVEEGAAEVAAPAPTASEEEESEDEDSEDEDEDSDDEDDEDSEDEDEDEEGEVI